MGTEEQGGLRGGKPPTLKARLNCIMGHSPAVPDC